MVTEDAVDAERPGGGLHDRGAQGPDELAAHRERGERGQRRTTVATKSCSRARCRTSGSSPPRATEFLLEIARSRSRTVTATPTSWVKPDRHLFRPTGSRLSGGGCRSEARRSCLPTRRAPSPPPGSPRRGHRQHRCLASCTPTSTTATSVRIGSATCWPASTPTRPSDEQRGAARAPRVPAGRHHPRRRRRDSPHPLIRRQHLRSSHRARGRPAALPRRSGGAETIRRFALPAGTYSTVAAAPSVRRPAGVTAPELG